MTSKDEKARRMELRKDVGNRIIEPSQPRPSGPDYRVAHACFECRKSFKIITCDETPKCPECSGEIYWMGRSFKAPKKTDIQQWKKVRLLYAHGFRFTGSGAHPPLPERLQDVVTFVNANPNHALRVAEPDKALL